ncbi:DUF4429 domain-containing protein [Lipingzhangella sp. LS1_29]|uniref:DUF4429 domain-containing protein n=1 Tax=Lipingzhangella rawalii TaxID=2055835 RepID=A0ABU2H9J9_9ACTN|nr:DUF4429 domain-containing protein [Lipingzhangella rawalii]MDS1271951.1 DUF4429 domain-containing protein [Lipingzhangella rawalii]
MDELRGHQATWRFDGSEIRIRYHTGWFKDELLQELGSCTVPVEAVAAVDFRVGTGRRKPWAMALRLREGADPYTAVGAQLSESSQPFRLTGSHKQELVAEYYADQIAFAAGVADGAEAAPPADPAVATNLVPALPVHIQTSEGTGSFDGATVRFVWAGSEASGRKKREQRREFALSDIRDVEWVPSDGWEWGHLRILSGAGGTAREGPPTKPKHDVTCLLCDEGAEGAATLLLAATIRAYHWALASPAAPHTRGSGAVAAAREAPELESSQDSADSASAVIYERIRQLAQLHAEGILTDEEFAAKKAQLLDRL